MLLALCCLVALVISTGTLHAPMMRVVRAAEAVISQHPLLGALMFIALAAVSAMVAFFSAALLVPVAVLRWGELATLAMLWLGWIGGGLASYVLAQSLGRRMLDRFAADVLEHFQRWLDPQTPFGVVLILQLSLPSEIPGVLLGLARYPLRKYLAVLVAAELPYALATVYLGEAFIERRSGLILAVGFAVAALSMGSLQILRGKLRQHEPVSTRRSNP